MPDGRSSIDDIIELYMRDVDVSLLKENLKLTPNERLQKMTQFGNFVLQMQEAGKKLREQQSSTTNSEGNHQ